MVNLAIAKENQAADAPFTTMNDHCCQKSMPETTSRATKIVDDLVAGLNQKVVGEESIAGEDDDLDKLEEACARRMAGDTKQTPTRKIVIPVIWF
ncbi:hypothetical protein TIFTF001_007782 [Ficus carica]|uniref:Uncharacterized protein n=1 Tax=Ficus carica TaxID=3494 RepID=A0AA88D2A7_FICCA|nr:hypothetical protein TIFTF001_007782 [Ficus carica]